MKALFATALLSLAFSAAAETIVVKGRAETLHSTYHTVTTCWYPKVHKSVAHQELRTLRVFQKQADAKVWKEIALSYYEQNGNAIAVVPQQSIKQTNNTRCPNLQIQFLM